MNSSEPRGVPSRTPPNGVDEGRQPDQLSHRSDVGGADPGGQLERGRALVQERPWTAVGAAVGAGLALGLVTGRRAGPRLESSGHPILRTVLGVVGRIAVARVASTFIDATSGDIQS